jgi:hypothetical protein
MSVEITCLTIDIFRLEVGLLTPVEVAQPARRPRRLHVVLHVSHVYHVLNKINTCQPAQQDYTMSQLLRPSRAHQTIHALTNSVALMFAIVCS